MKKKLFLILIIVFLLINVDMVNAEAFVIEASCDTLFTPEGLSLIRTVMGYIQILAPLVLIIMISVDMMGIVIGSDQNQAKKNVGKSAKRIIATICIFLVTVFVRLSLGVVGLQGAIVEDPLCSKATGKEAVKAVKVVVDRGGQGQGQSPAANYFAGNNQLATGMGGTGYTHTVSVGSRTYKVYNQEKYSAYGFWGGTIATHGCGPTSVAIVASGYGKTITPIQTSKQMSYGALDQIRNALSANGIKASYDKYPSGNGNVAIKDIRNHLATGRPVVVLVGKSVTANPACLYTCGGHFMVLLGENNGNLIIANPSISSSTGTLENLVRNYMLNTTKWGRGYLLVESY